MLLGFAAVLKAIAWPTVAVIACYFFRAAIVDFLKRVQKWEASPTGLKTEMLPATQQIETLKDAQETAEPKVSSEFAPLDPAYLPEYEKITAAVSRNSTANPKDQIESLKRMAAVIATQKQFEVIHRLIFNSQLHAIVTANQVGGRIPRAELQKIYAAASAQNSEIYANIPFDQWLKYLLDTRLLTVGEMTANLIWYEVTPLARMYLTYAVGAQLPPRNL